MLAQRAPAGRVDRRSGLIVACKLLAEGSPPRSVSNTPLGLGAKVLTQGAPSRRAGLHPGRDPGLRIRPDCRNQDEEGRENQRDCCRDQNKRHDLIASLGFPRATHPNHPERTCLLTHDSPSLSFLGELLPPPQLLRPV